MPQKFNFNRSLSTGAFQLCLLLLAIPALLINLGLMPLISDEPTRGIVSLEMLYSGDYIHPTINGELYFNKPPLFNWIQIFFIRLTGSTGEWVFRLPTILSTIALSLLIFYSGKKYLKEYSFIAAFSFIVAGRVLFWDSFMSLIDITYSLITFGSFIWIIHFKQRNKYHLLFLGSYFLASLGYLMKGMPSIAFQGLSIVSVFAFDKSFRKLFSIKHLYGIILFVILVGGYYYVYNIDHPILPVIERLISESNRFQDSSSNTIWWVHLFKFPLNLIYEFAPVTLLLFLLISTQVRENVFKERFFKYIGILFIVNIIIYWLSANMRSRYLFMLIPLLILILIQAYKYAESQQNKIFLIIRNIFIIGSFIISVSILVYPFWNETSEMKNVTVICILLFIASVSLSLAALRKKHFALYALFAALLLARTAFNMFNLPARMNSYPDEGYRDGEIKAAQISMGKPLFVLGDTPINHDASFYITRERKQLLKRDLTASDADAYYITDQENLDTFAEKNIHFRKHHTFTIKFEETELFLVTRQ
jgi:4-amino-4-deoxy-L-arabinose transferase-like glycosyltransferase